MELREIQAKDNLAIKQLIQQSLIKRNMAIPGTAYYDPSLADLFSFYQKEKAGKYWVIAENEEIIGGVGIASFQKENICELQKLYVRDDFQGQGLSQQLMTQALSFARQYYEYCYLETHSDLATACALYEKFGFQLLEKPLILTEHTAMNRWYLKKLT